MNRAALLALALALGGCSSAPPSDGCTGGGSTDTPACPAGYPARTVYSVPPPAPEGAYEVRCCRSQGAPKADCVDLDDGGVVGIAAAPSCSGGQ